MDDVPNESQLADPNQCNSNDSEQEGNQKSVIRRNSLFYRSMRRKRLRQGQSQLAPRNTVVSNRIITNDGTQERAIDVDFAKTTGPCWKVPHESRLPHQKSSLPNSNVWDRSVMPQNAGHEHWISGVGGRQASQQGSLSISGQRMVQRESHLQKHSDGQLAKNSAHLLKKATGSLPPPSHVPGESLASDLGSCSLREESHSNKQDAANMDNFKRNSQLCIPDQDSSDRFSPTRSKQNGSSSSIISRFGLMNRSLIEHMGAVLR